MQHPDTHYAAAQLISQATALIITAGAGMGVDSGLPDFRGGDGLWTAYPALKDTGIEFAEIAQPASFRSDPTLAWGFYGHRLNLYRQAIPHLGFSILRRWGNHMPHGMGVFTSNVDGQFQKAGFEHFHIVECHGSVHHLQCSVPCRSEIWTAEQFEPQIDDTNCKLSNDIPLCPHCGALARPNILMFEDWHWDSGRSIVQRQSYDKWTKALEDHAARVVIVEIGAGTAISTVRHHSHFMNRRFNAPVIRINLREADTPAVMGMGFPSTALDTLQAIDAFVKFG